MPELGLSLRKHKKKGLNISAPKPVAYDDGISPGQELFAQQYHDPVPLQRSEPSTNSVRSRPPGQGQGTTAEMVKRRYSTRVQGYPNDLGSLAPPMPSMPSIPHMYGGTDEHSRSNMSSRSGPAVGASGIKIDMRALRDPTLLPEQYVASLLADADELDIMNFQAELKKLQNRNSVDLQDNFSKNRTRFIQVSKEADVLKTEIKGLQGLMSELTAALEQATATITDSDSATAMSAKRSNRSSVANLEALWSTQLQTLWKRVEGSQKYLPAIPGRHIVCESSRWVELNAATWKPRRRVHIILLNDHMLVASEKKRTETASMSSPGGTNAGRSQAMHQQSGPPMLVAERCWPLADATMTDISKSDPAASARDDKSMIANAINVRVGTESWTFSNARTSEGKADKSALLVAFRKAVEDLRRTTAAEHGERERALDELAFLTGNDRKAGLAASRVGSVVDGGPEASINRTAVLVEVDGRQQNLRWIEAQIDALDMDSALQRFEEAVSRYEKLKKIAKSIKGHVVAQNIITAKVDERAARLSGLIRRRLKTQSAGLEATKENVSWLIRLGYDQMAKQDYLDARTETMRLRTRQLPFTGSLPPHLTALSYVTFTVILHTFKVFNASFAPSTSSAVVKWAKDRVDTYNASLKRQMGSLDPKSELWTECATIIQSRAAVLAEVGVDFTSLITRGLEASRSAALGNTDDGTAGRPRMDRKKSTRPEGSRDRERGRSRDAAGQVQGQGQGQEKGRGRSRSKSRTRAKDGHQDGKDKTKDKDRERGRSKSRTREAERAKGSR